MATTYLVLREDGPSDDPYLTRIGQANAETPRGAIKQYAEPEGQTPEPGVYIATPLRNWTEEAVTFEIRATYSTRENAVSTTATEEAKKLDEIIGEPFDEDTPVGEQIDETARRREAKKEKEAAEEFGPETEEPFDPTFEKAGA